MRGATLILLLVLTACSDNRSFDQRYEHTSKKLDQKARQLDQNLSSNAVDNRQD
jgi:hypothetical protein